MHYTRISPVLPPPSPQPTAASGGKETMLATVFMVVLLPCIGLCIVFLIYIFLLWCSTRRRIEVKPVTCKGLSNLELEKLPTLTGKELALIVRSIECAVCLEDIEDFQSARLVPGCNHGFHKLCVDTWLSDHTDCPLCRAELPPKLSPFSKNISPC